MPEAPQSQKLLNGVTRRLRFQEFVRAAYVSLLITTVVYAVVLLVSRLTGLIPNVFTWESLAAIPLATALLALLLHRRPEVRDAARAVYETVALRHEGEMPSPTRVPILTWDDRPNVAQFIGVVKKETALVLFIFGVVSLTAVFLVFAIFWSMVSEKTRDVGVLRAVGASRAGVMWLFLRYGLTLGVIGSLLGGVAQGLGVERCNFQSFLVEDFFEDVGHGLLCVGAEQCSALTIG